MKLRSTVVVLFLALIATSCGSSFFIVRDQYSPIKKVALVQYAINPHLLLGTPSSDDARNGTAGAAWGIFAKEMANNYEIIPFDTLSANAAYTALGKDKWDGYYTAKGARFLSADGDTLEAATIPADMAKKLCADLGVDGVAVVYEGWGLESYALGFKAHSRNAYVINLFDKNGVRVYGDVVWGTSEEGMASPGGIIAADVPGYLLNNAQAMTAALKDANLHLGGK